MPSWNMLKHAWVHELTTQLHVADFREIDCRTSYISSGPVSNPVQMHHRSPHMGGPLHSNTRTNTNVPFELENSVSNSEGMGNETPNHIHINVHKHKTKSLAFKNYATSASCSGHLTAKKCSSGHRIGQWVGPKVWRRRCTSNSVSAGNRNRLSR